MRAAMRQLTYLGCHCVVVAPAPIPRRPGDRTKTDRRDATALATLHRAGELTPVWVPDTTQEAIWRRLPGCSPQVLRLCREAGLVELGT